jgi:hypothetical protein
VLAGTAVAAGLLARHGSGGPVAAHVGHATISVASVEREVAAIRAQPVYASALGHVSATALAAPLDPKVVARANGDPDDLRITFAPSGNGLRPFTTADLKAAVLNRLMYVTALREVLAAKHAGPTTTEIADGRQEALLNAGTDASGRSVFTLLPPWYQQELSLRGADVIALVRVLFGTGGVTPQAVAEAYQRRLASDFTTVCLRSVVVAAGQETAGQAGLASGRGRDDGCAPLALWAPDVVAAVANTPAGAATRRVSRHGNVALLQVTRRTVVPLSTVSVEVHASLLTGYTDLINNMVEDELGLQAVTVAPQYGTYEHFGNLYEVVPPDALAPPSANQPQSPPPTEARQRLDPFE